MIIGNKEFDFEKNAYIMGILNMTPDSFSDGGKYNNLDDALFRVEGMIEDGATIIDIGGESTRPGYTRISDEEEIDRIIPIIESVKKCFDTVISVDTYKSKVAKAALDSGCDMINDIWGLKGDESMANIVASFKVPVCIMHNRENASYNDYMTDVLNDLKESVDIALKNGIDSKNIILDPGVGFAKDFEQNLQVINNVDKIVNLGYPVLLGTSRKSVIAKALDLPVDERVEGTIATTVLGYAKGCRIFRVHDVKENIRALRMSEAIINS